MAGYGKIPAVTKHSKANESKPPGPEVAAVLKKRLELLEQMAQLEKEYYKINSQLPFEMSHSSACVALQEQVENLRVRTSMYLKHGTRI